MYSSFKMIRFLAVPAVLGALCLPVLSSDRRPVAEEKIAPDAIGWIPKAAYAELELTVARPDGTELHKTFLSGTLPSVGLAEILGENRPQGSFVYELRATPLSSLLSRSEGKEEGERARERYLPERTQSGTFQVMENRIVNPLQQEITSGRRVEAFRPEDQVIADDTIVTGSLCVGFDCVNGESFGFDTVRLKENNLRLKFDDTSATTGFPANDWQLTANDSVSGGASKFSIEDITGAKVPVTVMAGAPSNSVFVSSLGRLGLKTAVPALDVHMTSGNTPAIRLDQDATGGFTPQIWDLAGNEANFFIRDVTGGSKLPLRIQPGTPSNTLALRSDGRVGIGTWSPEYPFELSTTGKNASAVFTRTDGARSWISATDLYGQFGTATNHPVRLVVNSAMKLQMNADNSIVSPTGAGLTAGGVWTNASSRAWKENIEVLTSAEAMDALHRLNAVKYNYKADREERHVGFIAEDAPDLVSSKDRKTMSPMDVVAVLTKVVQEQQALLVELQRKIAALEENR